MASFHSPQLGVDYHSRMEGGIFGAVGRAKERKRATLAREAQEREERKRRRQQRLAQQRNAAPALPPGQDLALLVGASGGSTADASASGDPRAITNPTRTAPPGGGASGPGTPGRPLAPSEVAALLADLNGGTAPGLNELMPVLLQCGADAAGQLPAQHLTAVVVAWNRRVKERGLPGLGPSGGGGGDDAHSRDRGDGGGLCSAGGCCSVS